MAELADIVIDCNHPASLARFWAAVLDDYNVAPYDSDELARLAAKGITDPEDDPTVLLEPSGSGPRIWLVQVPEPKSGKNRVHLDVRCSAIEPEVARLRELGAVLLTRSKPTDFVVMQDPDGNEFCVVT